MTKCVNCGTEADNASFCPECGAMIIRETISQTGAPRVDPMVSETPVTAPVPEQAPLYTPVNTAGDVTGDTSGYNYGNAADQGVSNQQPASVYPQYSGAYTARPSGSGQMVFAVINIILGTIMCCCLGLGIPALVLAIIAAVTASGANKAMTAEEAQSKIKTAMILNIISIVLTVIAVIIVIAVTVWSNSIDPNDYYSQYGYDFSSMFGS